MGDHLTKGSTPHPLFLKLSLVLAKHISGIDLNKTSRVPSSRLQERAIPNISLIELVNSEDFLSLYDNLYRSSFPKDPEREKSEYITDRLRKEFEGVRDGLAPFRVVGIRGTDGGAVGAAQFSVLFLKRSSRDEGSLRYAVPYLQYLYVRGENRRQDMAEVLHLLVLAVAEADARIRSLRDGEKWVVPFTLFETEPSGHGDDESSRDVATKRIMIHSRSGAVGVMLRPRSGMGADGEVRLISPHCQPGLEVHEGPLTLVWAIRPNPGFEAGMVGKCEESDKYRSGSGQGQDVTDIVKTGPSLIAAYYQSLRDEGFPESNIALAESIAADRCKDRDFVTVPLESIVLGPEARHIVGDE